MNESNLTFLANKYGSDKGTKNGKPPHKYTYLYDLLLDRYRDVAVNFLELGLARGGPEVRGGQIERTVDSPSVQMWLEYFPKAHIYGFDISDFGHIKHERFTFFRGDGGSFEDLTFVAEKVPPLDVIIDDGSHASAHQQLAFKALFPKLRSKGVYIIEDLQWQSPTYETNDSSIPKTRDLFISFFEKGTYINSFILSEIDMTNTARQVSSFSWFPAFDGTGGPAKVAIIRKR